MSALKYIQNIYWQWYLPTSEIWLAPVGKYWAYVLWNEQNKTVTI